MTKVNTDDDFDFGLPALALPPFSLAAFALPLAVAFERPQDMLAKPVYTILRTSWEKSC